MSLKPVLLAAVSIVAVTALAAPAAGQNSSSEAPVVAPPPPTKAQTPTPPPPPPPPPPSSEPVEPVVTDVPAQPTIVVPRVETAPPEPVTISPDSAYPNGFADPEDPFGNGMSLAYRQEEGGFDWGLLGLLGLLGLIPLFRNGNRRRVVYVEEEDEPARVVRRKRVDGE